MHQSNRFFSFPSLSYKLVYLIQLIIFFYLLRSSLYFSENFEQTQMRLIDDYAMQYSIHIFQNDTLNFDLQGIFFKYDYAYGWLFWFVFGFSTMPFRILFNNFPNQSSEQLLIISVRSVNIVLLFILLRVLTKIIQKILFKELEFTRSISILLATTIILTPTFGYWVGRPMPPIFAATILISAIYIAVAKRSIETRKLLLLAAVFGLAVGVKVNYLIYVPLCILLIAEIRSVIYGDHKIRFRFNQIIFKLVPTFLVGVVLSSSPALFIYPTRGFSKLLEIFNLFRSLSTSVQVDSFKQLLDNFVNGIALSGFGIIPQLAILFFAGYLFLVKFSRQTSKQSPNLLMVISLYILVSEIFLSYLLGLGTIYIQSYSLPMISIIPIYFSLITRKYALNNRKLFILVITFFVLIAFNFIYTLKLNDSNFPNIYSYQSMDKKAHQAATFELQNRMQSEIELGEQNIEIIQDHSLPTAWSGFRNKVFLTYAYNDWEKKTLSLGNNDLYLFIDKKNRAFYNDEFLDNSSSNQATSDQTLKNIVRSQTFLGRNCKLVSNEARYLSYICVASIQ